MSYPEQKYDMEKDEEALQACLPVVENNRKVVGALSVVGEVPPKNKNGYWKK